MTTTDIIRLRLHNQRIASSTLKTPAAVVDHMCAVQAQDYLAAKWAIGLRLQAGTDDVVEKAFTEGTILRTHILRPTWHFVTPVDIRWMLALTAPRVHTVNAYYYRKLGLDTPTLHRAVTTITNALYGKQYRTRNELVSYLEQEKVLANSSLLIAYILIYAELEGIICSGPRIGKQFTYALLDERAPVTKPLGREESLALLTKRYLVSHGPATVDDFAWWSGLTKADAKKGIEMVQSLLDYEEIDDTKYWFVPSAVQKLFPSVVLLPNFDEYIVGYTDRTAIFNDGHTYKLDVRANPIFQNTIVVDGQVVGTWKREFTRTSVLITPKFFRTFTKVEQVGYRNAVRRFSTFLDLQTED